MKPNSQTTIEGTEDFEEQGTITHNLRETKNAKLDITVTGSSDGLKKARLSLALSEQIGVVTAWNSAADSPLQTLNTSALLHDGRS